MLKELWKWFVGRTPEEDYTAGREYAMEMLGREDPPSLGTIEKLWAQSKTDRTFGGNGRFDKGINDVLVEAGYHDPEQPCFRT